VGQGVKSFIQCQRRGNQKGGRSADRKTSKGAGRLPRRSAARRKRKLSQVEMCRDDQSKTPEEEDPTGKGRKLTRRENTTLKPAAKLKTSRLGLSIILSEGGM